MQLTKCKWCGRPFQSFGISFCPRCMQELDDKYTPVRDYLYDNPNASIEEVTENTGVSERFILFYLKDGRLRMVNASGLLRCEQCGNAIDTGRLCEKCRNKLDDRMVQPIRNTAAVKERERQENEINNRSKMYVYKDRN